MQTGMGAVAASLLSLTLIACQTTPAVEEAPATTELLPMEQPGTPNIGYTLVTMMNGSQERRSEVIAHDAETFTWRNNKGCEWSSMRTGFSPSVHWKNCEGGSGNMSVKLTTDLPWPLSVGKTWTYTFTGGNNRGNAWEGSDQCTVVGTARVTAPIGTYDTFKVECESEWLKRTHYLSPELNASPIFLRHNKARNQTDRYELIRIENNNRGS